MANARFASVHCEQAKKGGPKVRVVVKADADMSALIPVVQKRFTLEELGGVRIGQVQQGWVIVGIDEYDLMKVKVARVEEVRTFVRITFRGRAGTRVVQLGNHMVVRL
jgi:hypothetical protein